MYEWLIRNQVHAVWSLGYWCSFIYYCHSLIHFYYFSSVRIEAVKVFIMGLIKFLVLQLYEGF